LKKEKGEEEENVGHILCGWWEGWWLKAFLVNGSLPF
jgi:hypothetical protein